MTFNDIYKRVCDWNEKRTPRTYNHQLTIDLLNEEHNELLEAQTDVDRLDALCDIIFVASGALWKRGADSLNFDIVSNVGLWVKGFEDDPVDAMLIGTIIAAVVQMEKMGLSEGQALKALSIVCDANDSKEIRMMNADTKIEKGFSFVAPEPRLEKLLRSVK